MSNETNKKEPMSVVKKMMIALVGGLAVGLLFLFLRENVISEEGWAIVNKLLFQDITVPEGVGAIGIFYIVGQIFMKGLQLAIVRVSSRSLQMTVSLIKRLSLKIFAHILNINRTQPSFIFPGRCSAGVPALIFEIQAWNHHIIRKIKKQ